MMSETTASATELTSQYIAQVTNDLDRNVKEQERISAEISTLQEQLAGLERDHSVLMNMQQALGVKAVPADTVDTADRADVPSPRRESTEKSGKARKRSAQARPAGKKQSAKKQSTKKPDAEPAASKAAQPTLVELVRRHLTEQSEPRSAAEIGTALGQAHTDRDIRTTVVRTTLEGLVAKNQAQRNKQGTSVFYTAPQPD
jgi:hypothetical protein